MMMTTISTVINGVPCKITFRSDSDVDMFMAMTLNNMPLEGMSRTSTTYPSHDDFMKLRRELMMGSEL